MEEVTVSGTIKLVEDISSFYQEVDFSDVVFALGSEKIRAHKAILAARSNPLRTLLLENAGQPEIEIDASVEAFQMLLKFIYTGSVTVKLSGLNAATNLLILSYRYELEDLKSALMSKIKDILDLDKALEVLSFPHSKYLNELIESCYQLLDENSSKALKRDGFELLTQTSLVKLLERSTFVVTEIEMFNAVVKWRNTNEDVDNLVAKSVRLQCLSIPEILLRVRPTKMVDNEELLDAIAEVAEVTPRTIPCRGILDVHIVEENLATSDQKAEVISGNQTDFLLSGNKDVSKCASHKIGNKKGITIKLGKMAFVNHIHMRLLDQDNKYYTYYVEASIDGNNWLKLIDYSQYHCRSEQNLYFEETIVRYVRAVGTFSSVGDDFELVSFEVSYKKNIPKLINGVVLPTENVATLNRNVIVIQGGNPDEIINGNYTNFDSTKGWTYHTLNKDSIIIQLPQPYIISSLAMLLYNDEKSRSFRYFVESSVNKTDWKIVVDKREGEHQSWQHLCFTERPVVYIKITGTYHSIADRQWLFVVHLESPDRVA